MPFLLPRSSRCTRPIMAKSYLWKSCESGLPACKSDPIHLRPSRNGSQRPRTRKLMKRNQNSKSGQNLQDIWPLGHQKVVQSRNRRNEANGSLGKIFRKSQTQGQEPESQISKKTPEEKSRERSHDDNDRAKFGVQCPLQRGQNQEIRKTTKRSQRQSGQNRLDMTIMTTVSMAPIFAWRLQP
jgi:hypothetical protein